MSILKNFFNPWEADRGVLESDVLDMGVLENDVLNNDILTSEDYDNSNTHILLSLKKGQNENELIAKVEANIFYKILNCSKYDLRTHELNARNYEMNDYLKMRFTFLGEMVNFNLPYDFESWKPLTENKYVTVKYEVEHNYKFVAVDNSSMIRSRDLIVAVVSKVGRSYVKELGEYVEAIAFHGEGKRIMAIEKDQMNATNKSFWTLAHEEGHRLVLPHSCNHKCLNLMSYYSENGRRGTTINTEQQEDIYYGYHSRLFSKFFKMKDKKKRLLITGEEFGNLTGY